MFSRRLVRRIPNASLPEFMIFTTELAHFVLVRSLFHDPVCTLAVRVLGMVRFFDMHVDWANVV